MNQSILSCWALANDYKLESLRKNKSLVQLESTKGEKYFLKGEKQEQEVIERICSFASELREIMPVPEYLLTVDGTFTVMIENDVFTLEKAVEGIEIESLTDNHIVSVAEALGKMHKFSLETNYRMGRGTTWSLFGGNQTENLGDYDENELCYLEFIEEFKESSFIDEIKESYLKLRLFLQMNWLTLPKVATQGDFCYYNMVFEKDEISGIFDFNLAGDEVAINECLGVAVYHSWHAPYSGDLSEEERFDLFCNAYQKIRPWSKSEKQVSKELKKIIRAFRHDRIAAGIASENQDSFLVETLEILNE